MKETGGMQVSIRRLSWIVLSCLALLACEQQVPDGDRPEARTPALFPIVVADTVGFIDVTGQVVIEPQFEQGSDFSEGLAAVMLDGMWGYVDGTGEFAIEPQFEAAADFATGLAAAAPRGGAFGYIDKTGDFVIGALFERAFDFSDNGLAGARLVDGEADGYIDRRGRFVIEPEFDLALPFNDGIALVVVGSENYFIDGTGRRLFGETFEAAGPFREGLAPVQRDGKWGYIDTSGRLAIPRPPWWRRATAMQFDDAGLFHEGLAHVRLPARPGSDGFLSRSAYINRDGDVVFELDTDVLSGEEFSDGLAKVLVVISEGEHAFGYVNRSGEMVIEPRYKPATAFRNGLAWVATADRYGYIDRDGEWVWSASMEGSWLEEWLRE